MALLLYLILSISHLQLRVFHSVIPSNVRGLSVEPAVIFVKPHGCQYVRVTIDGPDYHSSTEPAEEDKTHRFEYRDLATGSYVVFGECLSDGEVISTAQATLQVS